MSRKPDPNWTFEEAWKAHLEDIHKTPSMQFDPGSRFSRWCVLQELQRLHLQFEQGDEFSLMLALRECARTGLPMPDWVAQNYIRAFDDVLNYRAKSWDEVFGNPLPKGAHLSALKKKREFKYAVFNEVEQARRAGTAVDEHLFETAGKKFNIGKTLASEFYYEAKSRLLNESE